MIFDFWRSMEIAKRIILSIYYWAIEFLWNEQIHFWPLLHFSLFLFFLVTPPKKSIRIKIAKRCDSKRKQRTSKTMTKLVEWIWREKNHDIENFDKKKREKSISRKAHDSSVYKWWWICHFIASFFFYSLHFFLSL